MQYTVSSIAIPILQQLLYGTERWALILEVEKLLKASTFHRDSTARFLVRSRDLGRDA